MELAISISPHVSFSADFPGVKRICCARSVKATVPAVPADVVSRITLWEWQGCALGVAVRVTRGFTLGPLPSDICGMCIADCAATWICSAFRASMDRACWLGYFASVAFLLIAARRAGIASSHFEFTAALFPLSNPWSPVQKLIPSRTRIVLLSATLWEQRIDFPQAVHMIVIGDGVRLITAVQLAGQMMTPDKYFVAESCPRQ
jgi:hypothetical protein